MQRETAETMCAMLDDILERLSAFNNFVNANELGEGRTGQAIAVCVTEIDLEILEPIYRAFPDLKPDYLT